MLMFNNLPYPQGRIRVEEAEALEYWGDLAYLEDAEITQIIEALHTVSEYLSDYSRPFGVCHWVDREVYRLTSALVRYSGYRVIPALGMVWPGADLDSKGALKPYFCDAVDSSMGDASWTGENYARRMLFVQFCIDELTEFMQNREGTVYIPS